MFSESTTTSTIPAAAPSRTRNSHTTSSADTKTLRRTSASKHGHSHSHSHNHSHHHSHGHTNYVDQDWAKDVRWLVPPSGSTSKHSNNSKSKSSHTSSLPPLPRSRHPRTVSVTPTSSSNLPSISALSNSLISNPQPMKPSSPSYHRTKFSSGPIVMTAVVEEPGEIQTAPRRHHSHRSHSRGSSAPLIHPHVQR